MQCDWCGEGFERKPGKGRRPRFCSGRCRVAAHRAAKLPSEMTEARRWVRADGKRPIRIDGCPASSTNPGTWASLAEVRASSAGDGMGVMLGDGLGCYDLDHVSDAEIRGFLSTVPEPVLMMEWSMSGRGAHIFIAAPEGRGWKRQVGGISVERYTRARFIRTTLRRIT